MNKLYCPDCSELLKITGTPYCKPLYCKKCNKSHNYSVNLHIKKNIPMNESMFINEIYGK